MKKNILMIGSANADRIMRLPVLPGRGETVTGGSFMQTFGGKGANQAVAAARAGADVSVLMCLGKDSEGDQILEHLRADGIDTRLVLRDPQLPTGAALVLFDKQGDNYLGVAPGANFAIFPEHIDAIATEIAGAGLIILQMEIPRESVLRTLEICRRHDKTVLLNFAPAHPDGLPLPEAVSILVVNETEAAALSGTPVASLEDGLRVAAHLLPQVGEAVMVTLGRLGTCLATRAGCLHVPAYEVAAVDSTAAGDTYCGAFAAARMEGSPLEDAVRFATAAAAISVTRLGAQPSIPRRAEIEDFLSSHGEGST